MKISGKSANIEVTNMKKEEPCIDSNTNMKSSKVR